MGKTIVSEQKILVKIEREPEARFELATYCLQNSCSATELLRQVTPLSYFSTGPSNLQKNSSVPEWSLSDFFLACGCAGVPATC